MPAISLEALLAHVPKAKILEKGLAVARAVGLPVSTWHPGDPTRSLFLFQAEILEVLEGVIAPYVASAFLDYVQPGPWLRVALREMFNEELREATYATPTCTLTNTGGGEYTLEPGGVTARSSVNGKTYHSTSGGTLAPRPPGGNPTTLVLTFEADEPGASSSVGAGEIDELVTTLLGVTISNAAAAVGLDEEDKDAAVARARAKLGALSPNGPRDAYMFVALTPRLTGATNITRARSVGDSDTGDVTLYIASPSGPVAEAERLLVEQSIVRWATPLCITPTVANSAGVLVDVTYELWIYRSVNETREQIEASVERALRTMSARRPIGGDLVPPTAGRLYHSMIASTIRGVYPGYAFRVSVPTPAADVALAPGEVPIVGAVNATIHLVEDP